MRHVTGEVWEVEHQSIPLIITEIESVEQATRRARGLEAAVVDNSRMDIKSLDPNDQRNFQARVAGPAALLVAKAHKIGERLESNPGRLDDKDAHDAYRIFVDVSTKELAAAFVMLREHDVSATATTEAIDYLRTLFAGAPMPRALCEPEEPKRESASQPLSPCKHRFSPTT